MHYDAFVRRALPALDLNWRKYRRRQSRRGVRERMNELGLPAYEDYLAHLRAHPEEVEALIERMRVTVTRFFRDRRCWEAPAKDVLPGLLRSAPNGVLRAFSAGCAGGEEPYSLALLWKERFEEKYPGAQLRILAADVDGAALDRARAGIYPPGAAKEVPREMRGARFSREGDRLVLDRRVRGMVQFKRLDAVRDDLPGEFDLVLCRYLFFTYFTGERLREAAKRLHAALRPGGVLMTGAREDAPRELEDLFTPRPGPGSCFSRRI